MAPFAVPPAAPASLIPTKKGAAGGAFRGGWRIQSVLGQVLGRPWVNMMKRQYQRVLLAQLAAELVMKRDAM